MPFFKVFSLDEIKPRSSFVGLCPGLQFPNLPGENSSNSVIVSGLLHEISLPRKAETPSSTGSPRILWLALNPDWQLNENMARSRRSEKFFGTFLFEIVWVEELDVDDAAILESVKEWGGALRDTNSRTWKSRCVVTLLIRGWKARRL